MGEKEVLIDVVESSSTCEIGLTSIQDKSSLVLPEFTSYPPYGSYGTSCIFKLPEKHCHKNEEVYAPRVVPIGLVQFEQRRKIHDMDEHKHRYLQHFMKTFQVSYAELRRHMDHDGEWELVSSCYESCDHISSENREDKVAAVLCDGIFIIELFLRNHFPRFREEGDKLFENGIVLKEVLHDLLLLENQLPFGFLYTLYEKFVRKKLDEIIGSWNTSASHSFEMLAHEYFSCVGYTRNLERTVGGTGGLRHFVEFLAVLHMPAIDRGKTMYRTLVVEEEKMVENTVHFSKCPNATKLKEMGVKFKPGNGSLSDIRFKDGELTIPPFTVNGSTETFFLNLIAFEQTGNNSKHTTSFAILLDNLIDSAEDVDLLIKHGIIKNELQSPQHVADIFNSLYKEFLDDPKEFYFIEECELLNEYSRNPWHKARAKLSEWAVTINDKYFSNPWSFCSLLAAVIILALTATQTAYAIKTYKRGH